MRSFLRKFHTIAYQIQSIGEEEEAEEQEERRMGRREAALAAEPVSAIAVSVPAMGEWSVDPEDVSIPAVLEDAGPLTPVLFLLSPGSDPTENLQTLARSQKMPLGIVSMVSGSSGPP